MGHDWPDAPVAVLAMTGASIYFYMAMTRQLLCSLLSHISLTFKTGCNVLLLIYLFDKPDK